VSARSPRSHRRPAWSRAGELEQGLEALDGKQLGDVGSLAVARVGRQERPVLECQLRRGCDLDAVDALERPLCERREAAQRLDLDVEQLDPDRALGRRAEDVEQAAADGELAALLDLPDALVAHIGERLGALIEVQQIADSEREGVRAQRGVRHLLGQCRCRYDKDRRTGGAVCLEQRIERGDSQADEVRRRRQVGLVCDAA
jgi:hypothetical protein